MSNSIKKKTLLLHKWNIFFQMIQLEAMTVSGFVSLLFNIGIKLFDICCDFHFIFYSGQKLGKTYSSHFFPKYLIFGVVFVCHCTRCGAPLFDMRVKVCLHVTFFSLCPLLPQLLNMFFYCHQNNGEKMGLSPILSVIHTITISTMLNLTGVITNTGYKRLRINRP